jgi:DNA-binding NtrC family response regulator
VDEPLTQPKLSTVIRPLDDLEAEAIKAAIAHYGRHLEGLESAATALGISRATLYRKIKRYEVDL